MLQLQNLKISKIYTERFCQKSYNHIR